MLTLIRENVIARLVTYYVAVLGLFLTLYLAFPPVLEIITGERMRQVEAAPTGVAPVGGTSLGETLPIFSPQVVVPVALGMLGAFLLALPVAWVYVWTRPPRKGRKAVAQTLVILPIGIALVVFLVKGSLALAFSLAGIVAAVRWRASLADTMDAVFLFVIIGIGLSAGVQLLFVSYLGSLAFVAAVLGVWRRDFGEDDRVLVGWRLARPSGGDPPVASGATVPPVEEAVRYNTFLRVRVMGVPAAEQAIATVLDGLTKTWRQARVERESGDNALLEYEARFKKSTDLAAVVREIEQQGAPYVRKVELSRARPGAE